MSADTDVTRAAPRIPPRPTGPFLDEPLPVGGPAPLSGAAAGFLPQLLQLVIRNYAGLPQFLTRNGIWAVPLAVVWILMHSIGNGTLSRLPGPLPGLASLLIFLTATYNGFIGKATFVTVINSLILPFIRQAKTDGPAAALRGRLGKWTQTVGIIRRAWRDLGDGALKLLLITGGAGFFVANILSRNNKSDKYLVSLLSAIAIINALSRGLNDPAVKLFRALLRDAAKFSGRTQAGSDISRVYLGLGGLAAGLGGSLLFNFVRFTNSFYDATGYIIGGLCMAGGIAWSLAGAKNAHGQQA